MQLQAQLNQIMPQYMQPQAQPEAELHSLFVGDLDKNMYDSELYNFFARHGFKPKKAKVIFDKATNKHKGFGYVAFVHKEDAARALETLQHSAIGKSQIRLMWKQSKGDVKNFKKEANVFVKDLEKSVTAAALEAEFARFGTIESCKVELWDDGNSREMGYVQFSNGQEAQKAIAEMNGAELHGKKITVTQLQS
jgi:RNA recognition motif-containing protein